MKIYLLSLSIIMTLLGCNNPIQDKNGPEQETELTVYSGTFKGKDLFFLDTNFCIKKFIINNSTILDWTRHKDTIDKSHELFEVDFKKLNIKNGDSVVLTILHKKDCISFKCLNREAIQ